MSNYSLTKNNKQDQLVRASLNEKLSYDNLFK